jgi:pimeloyl-ACP methyl ester carboxylesterase
VLGHSFGGVVAQVLYHRHPDRVRALILADTNVGGGALDEPERSVRVRQRIDALERLGPRGMAEQRAPALVSPGAPADLLAELIDIMAEVRSAGYSQAAMALGNADTSGLLSAIDVPTLVIHGEHDSVVPLATGQMLAQRIPRAQLAVIPNAGHAAPQEQPAAFDAAVRAFLESLG